MIGKLGDQVRIAATQSEQPAEPEKQIAKEVIEAKAKPLSAQETGMRKAESALSGISTAAFLRAQLNKVIQQGAVGVAGTAGTDPIESDPAFQQLPPETKQRVLDAIRNAPGDVGKSNIRKLATDPNFDAISPQSQKAALDDIAEDPSSDGHVKGVFRTCSDMVSLENNADFKKLPADTQQALRTDMFHFSGNDSIRDSLIGFAQNPDFAKMSSANQQRTLSAFLANPNTFPSGNNNSVYLNNIIGSPAFQKMDEATQQQVLSMASSNSTDEHSMQNISKFLRDPSFEQLSPASQKTALDDLAENPASDAHVQGARRTCSDMVSLENNPDFQKLPGDTRQALRTDMFHFSGNDSIRDSLIGFAQNPDFAKMSSANQQRTLSAFLANPNTFPSGNNNSVYLNNIIGSPAFQKMDEATQQQVLSMASSNSADEHSMQNISKFLRDPSFEQLSPASQKTALDDLAEDPASDAHVRGVRSTCSDMVSLENNPGFQSLSTDTQGSLRTAMFQQSGNSSTRDALIFFAQNPDFAKMSSGNQQQMLSAFLANPSPFPSGNDNSLYLNNMIASSSFQGMGESMQQRVLSLASKNSASEDRMKQLSDLLRDPQFINGTPEDQSNFLDSFEANNPGA